MSVQGSHNPISGMTTYHGVPFAKAPVGELRWRPAERPTPWNTTKKTTSHGPICPQLDLIKGLMFGKEDCLYLSLWVPPACGAKPCPVMQWIYGAPPSMLRCAALALRVSR